MVKYVEKASTHLSNTYAELFQALYHCHTHINRHR